MKTKSLVRNRCRPFLERLEGRECPADRHWVGGDVVFPNNWFNNDNWAEGVWAGPGDRVIIDENSTTDLLLGGQLNPVNHTVAAIVNNGAGNADLVIGRGYRLTISGGDFFSFWDWDPADPNNDRIIMRDISELNITNDACLVSNIFVIERESMPDTQQFMPTVNITNGGNLDIAKGMVNAEISVGVSGSRNAGMTFGGTNALPGFLGNNLLQPAGTTLWVGMWGTLTLDQTDNQSQAGGILASGVGEIDVYVSSGGKLVRTGTSQTDNAGPIIDGKVSVMYSSEFTIGAGSALRVTGKAGDVAGVELNASALVLHDQALLKVIDKDVSLVSGSSLALISVLTASIDVGPGALILDGSNLEFQVSGGLGVLNVVGNVRVLSSHLYFTAFGGTNGQCDYLAVTGVFTVTGGVGQASTVHLNVIDSPPEVTFEYDTICCVNSPITFQFPGSTLLGVATGELEGLIALSYLTNNGKYFTFGFASDPGGEEEGE